MCLQDTNESNKSPERGWFENMQDLLLLKRFFPEVYPIARRLHKGTLFGKISARSSSFQTRKLGKLEEKIVFLTN